jgi:hypothetical protein
MTCRIPELVTCVSFPRSGNHLLVNFLMMYYSKNIDHWKSGSSPNNNFREVVNAGEFVFCEYYKHCRESPCTDPKVNFQKQHDFDLGLPVNEDGKYIVQIREPIATFISYYEWHLKSKFPQNKITDSKKEWEIFVGEPLSLDDLFKLWKKRYIGRIDLLIASAKAVARRLGIFQPPLVLFWKEFVSKWIINNENQNVLFVRYENLIDDPAKQFSKIIRFMSPQEIPDVEIIEEIVVELNVKQKRLISDFRHFESCYINRLRNGMRNEIAVVERIL